MAKLLVTGASGFLGSYLEAQAPTQYELFGTYLEHAFQSARMQAIQVDLSVTQEIDQMIDRIQPDAIFHFAALSKPNACEKDPEQSYAVNVASSLVLAEHCQKRNIPFLYTSTDQVFSGEQGPYEVGAPTDGINTYGKHKRLAERLILRTFPQAIIARMPLMYGWPQYGQNFLPAWVQNLQKGEILKAFSDEYRSPTHGADAVAGLFLLLEKQATGIWHLGGTERLSRSEFAEILAEVWELPTDQLQPCLQADVQMAAPRPADVSMDSTATHFLGYQPKTVREGLQEIRASLAR